MAATLLELRNGVLTILNDLQDEVTGTGERYRTSLLNRFINNSIRFYTRYLNSFFQGYLSSTISINVIAGQDTYALGSSFRSPIYEVRRTIDQTDFFLEEFTPYNASLSVLPTDNNQWVPFYYLEGNNIRFSTPPSVNELAAIRVRFQSKLTDLSSDIDELDDQLYDAEECIKMRAAIQALRGKDVSGAFKNVDGWGQELQENERTFFMQVGNRYVKPDRPIPTTSGSGFDY